jgi:hypothetical protein
MDRNDEPLTHHAARAPFLAAICAAADGDTALKGAGAVATVLRDRCRFAVLGGRAGMRRSLGSVHAMNVLLFLGSGFRGAVERTFETGVWSTDSGFAVTRCGSLALLGHCGGFEVCRVTDGASLRTIGTVDTDICQIWVAADDFVFVAGWRLARVQVLTPQLDVCSIIPLAHRPRGVCANETLVFVSEYNGGRVAVFSRAAAYTLLHYISIENPKRLCFMPMAGTIAVIRDDADVVVLTPEGAPVRCIGADVLHYPIALACSVYDELVVADGYDAIIVVDGDGKAAKTISVLEQEALYDSDDEYDTVGITVSGRNVFYINCGKIAVFV